MNTLALKFKSIVTLRFGYVWLAAAMCWFASYATFGAVTFCHADANGNVTYLAFFVGSGTLLGAAIVNVTENEARQLEAHLQSARKQ